MLRKLTFALGLLTTAPITQASIDLSQVPLFVSDSVPPLNMLVMGRDHKLYYEAYNDASDLNGDGVIDVGYKGHLSKADGGIDYYGYFNSHVCYRHDGDKFTPVSASQTKKCSGNWSGDFLNYLTTSRMDALRKVLYGGYRVTDTTTETVLQAAFIPQDAHTWGKEYLSESHDGYKIADYTELSQPVSGYRHLFAVVSLTDGGIPQLRTLTNTPFRVWNWVSQERPVAGNDCTNAAGTKVSCTSEGVGDWSIVPAEMLSDLILTTWKDNQATATSTVQMDQRFNPANQLGNLCGSGHFPPPINTITNFQNPYTGSAYNNCTQDNYHTSVKGKLTAPITGNYEFSVDGDDAVDFVLWKGGSRHIAAHRYGDQGASNTGGAGTTTSKYYLEAGKTYDIEVRHEENGGDASFRLYWKIPASAETTIVDRNIRVSVCPDNENLRESNCVSYATGKYKPTGILHDYGATDKMFFGLLSGSYEKNISGGVLRSQLQSFSREFDAATGRFCSSAGSPCSATDAVTSGIVDTINKFRVIDFNYGDHVYGCGWITDRPITQDDTCYMWGNPIGEMMYETMRYFSGATSPTPEYDYSSGKDSQSPLNLPKIDNWTAPYKTAPQCAVPVMTVISDINPSYDYKLPGSHWSTAVSGAGNPSSISSLDVSAEADKIWEKEGSPSGPVFIGESNGISDGAPTAKAISNFSTIRGLSPEEPTKQGTYYSAAVAHFGANNKIGGDKSLLTYAVALASPLPTFEFPVGNSSVTIVPFAKSVGGSEIDASANFQPTDQIVDFYVETIANTDQSCPTSGRDCDESVNDGRPYAKFRINFEDVEQGADHDMDAISLYEIMVNTEGKLIINMTSEYAAGGIDQHMGYVISGTTRDGIYLEVKDQGGSDIAYKLDTPEGKWAGECTTGNCNALTRLSSSRTFTVSGSASANFLENPLWYAAKYGTDASDVDIDKDGVPDNYFLVTNALTLKDQLAKAFNDITQRNASVTAPSVDTLRDNTTAEEGTAYIYRTTFDVNGWTGDLLKEERVTTIDPSTGQRITEMARKWSAESQLPSSRTVYMSNSSDDLIDFTWANRASAKHDLEDALNSDGHGQARVGYIRGDGCSAMAGCSTFRTRSSRLGDIVNSSPVLVKDAQYLTYRADSLDGSDGKYRSFQEKVASRPPMIYVGANDGMLHAFNADDGKEVFAFIPTPVIENLDKLTDPDYGEGTHQFYVDGTPVVADVYYNNEWHTVLLGSLGAGGRGVFALDITNPAQPELLWELTSDDDPDMGYSLPQPSIARLHNGRWAALIPNGYNSGSASEGKAVLFIVDIATGEVKKLEATTKETEGSFSNGLSSVRTADFNGDGVVDYAYAGDLRGNIWRFDLLDTDSSTPFAKTTISADKFKVSFSGTPLFVATDGTTRQPITAAPSLVRHPTSMGYLVIAGTGRYLSGTDKTSTALQSVYGIWDRQTAGETAGTTKELSRIALQEQTITEETTTITGENRTVRLLSEENISWYQTDAADTEDHSVKTWGWFLDLKAEEAKGERVVDDMRIYGDGLVFSTITPNADPCSAGLDGFIYAINPSTGGRTAYNVFDLSGDGLVNTDDSQDGEVVSGLEAPAGGWSISDGELYFTDGSSIKIDAGNLSSGRQSWRLIPSADD